MKVQCPVDGKVSTSGVTGRSRCAVRNKCRRDEEIVLARLDILFGNKDVKRENR